MGERGGFVAVYRKVVDSWLWSLPSDHIKVAIQLLVEANWKPSKIMRGGEVIEVPRGSCVIANRTLAERTKLGVRVIRTALKNLEKGGFLTRKPTRHHTVISVVNYETYQGGGDEPDPQPDPRPTHARPTPDPIITREQGEQGNKSVSAADKPPGWGALSKAERKVLARHLGVATEMWSAQNAKRKAAGGSRIRDLRPKADSLLRIAKLLESGRTRQDCLDVLEQYARDAQQSGEMRWFDGVTNWRPENFDRALGMFANRGKSAALPPPLPLERKL